MSLFVKKGDTVVILSGEDKGSKGKVLQVLPDQNKVIVEGLNVAFNFKKPRNAQEKGGIIKSEAALDASKVMLVCPACEKPSRLKYAFSEDGKKYRVCPCGAKIEAAKEEKADKKKSTKKKEKADKPAKEKKAKTDTADKKAKTEAQEKKAKKAVEETVQADTEENS